MQRLILRGVSWKLVGQVGVQVLRVLFALILARLLTPAEFGLAAMAMVIAGFVIAFSDLGLGAALVQRRTIDQRDRSTVFWTGIAFGTALTLCGVALSGLVADFYGEPAVQGLMAALSLSFVISALATTQRSLLLRDMDFRRLELSGLFSVAAGGVVGVAGAMLGWGAWALVAQQIATVAVWAAFLWVASSWRPSATFSASSLRSLGGYGAHVLGTRIAYRAQESSLPLIIGRTLGASSLGIFTIAYTVILVPLTRLAIPIGDVLLPAFSRMQEERERIAMLWVRAVVVLAGICAPAMLGLAIVAPEFVEVILGDQWDEAVPVIRILAWVGLLQALGAWNSTVLMGLGRTRTMFRVTIALFVLYLGAFVVGSQWGLIGVSVAYAAAETILGGSYIRVVTRALGIPFRTPVVALGGVAQATLGMGIGVAIVELGLDATETPAALQLSLTVVCGVLLYVPLLLWRAPDVAAELRALRGVKKPPAIPTGS